MFNKIFDGVSGCYECELTSSSVTFLLKVDVDGSYPQNVFSLQITKNGSFSQHLIAKVEDKRDDLPTKQRIITGNICYIYPNDDSNKKAIPIGQKVIFCVCSDNQSYTLSFPDSIDFPDKYLLSKTSNDFEPIEIKYALDYESGLVSSAITEYDTDSCPVRANNLKSEKISLENIFYNVGFNLKRLRESKEIKASSQNSAGDDGKWTTAELHNAMYAYFSGDQKGSVPEFWAFYAGRHNDGSLSGLMFDNLGSKLRQGLAIFVKQIEDLSESKQNSVAWRNRQLFWAIIHEIGHTFNLAHPSEGLDNFENEISSCLSIPSTQSKNIGPLSFMVNPVDDEFFSKFEYRFSDLELIKLRHAPREIVRQGSVVSKIKGVTQNNDNFEFRIKAKKKKYNFLEPVFIDFIVTNISSDPLKFDRNTLTDGHWIFATVTQINNGGKGKNSEQPWKLMNSRCNTSNKEDSITLEPKESCVETYNLSVSSIAEDPWIIKEPGSYEIEAELYMAGRPCFCKISIEVANPSSIEEEKIAKDYFCEDIARALVFGYRPGSYSSNSIENTLHKITGIYQKEHPTSLLARFALTRHQMLDYKWFDFTNEQQFVVHTSKIDLDCASHIDSKSKVINDLNIVLGNPKNAELFGVTNFVKALERYRNVLINIGHKDLASKLLDSNLANSIPTIRNSVQKLKTSSKMR